jgi:penicillin-binding protein activator
MTLFRPTLALLAGATLLTLSGCMATTGDSPAAPRGPGIFGQQGGVSMIDAGERGRVDTQLTMADYLAFAEKVTDRMLSSPQMAGWAQRPPRVILGDVANNTDNENIRVRDIYDRIQETMFNSGLVRVVDRSATNFQYVVRPELTSTRQRTATGEELAFFTLQLKLFNIEGELVGHWSDDLALARAAGRRLF